TRQSLVIMTLFAVLLATLIHHFGEQIIDFVAGDATTEVKALALTQSAGITFLQGVESVRETMRCPYWVQLLTQIQHDISNGH
ncbi:hypothetical protein MMS56_29155, partial [Escherichia coli]|nr:hypothetical protein [Escherichia coli]